MWQPHLIQANQSHICMDPASRVNLPHLGQIPLPVPVLKHVIPTPTPLCLEIKRTNSDAIQMNITTHMHYHIMDLTTVS
jgi:hypothetical protein